MSEAADYANAPFDLIIIGTGPAASRICEHIGTHRWRIAVVDRHSFGGTCALRGCNPKKALVRAAELSDWYRRMNRLFVEPASPRLNWRSVIEFKREFTDPVTRSTIRSLTDKGIHCIRGVARFKSPSCISVDGDLLFSKRFVIATGAEPVELGIEGANLLTSSNDFLDLEELPARIVFVGGGYISFEFAHAAARAGAQCTIIDRGTRPLSAFDPDLVDRLVRYSCELGIDVRLGCELESVTQLEGGDLELHVRGPVGQETIQAGLAVHGAGRAPALKDLHLEAGEVAYDSRLGVSVDCFLRSRTNPAVFAAGDAADTGAPKLSPVASYEGRVVARNLIEVESTVAEYGAIPTVVFTVPPLAAVGLTEAQALDRGVDFRVESADQSDWNEVRKLGHSCAACKLLIERSSDRILGAHLLGPGVDESINLFALMIQAGQPSRLMKETLLAFPTLAAGSRKMV